MPRTASIQKTVRSARKTRAAADKSAPVLFRFPDLSVGTDVEDDHSETAMQADAVSAAADTPTSSTVAEPSRAPEESSPIAQAAPPESKTVEPKIETASEALSRSWWEHWSSGIVLLLLVCALLAAGVLAFSDRGTPSQEQLADGTTELNIPELSEIDIPDIDTSLAAAVDAQLAHEQLAGSGPAVESPAENVEPSAATVDLLPPKQPVASAAEVAGESLVPDSFVLGGESLAGPALSIQVDRSGEDSVAGATVGMPIVDGSTPSAASSTDEQIGFSLPALPVSETRPQSGQSPPLYDGAMLAPTNSSELSQQGTPPLPSKTDDSNATTAVASRGADGNPPATQSNPGGLPAQLASGPNQLPVTDAAHSTSYSPIAAQPVVSASGAMVTASPDMDPAVFIRAWKELRAKQLTVQPESYLPPPAR